MNEFTQGLLVALIPALMVSIISPIITVKLSMKKFYSQRWWERKAGAYSEIIESLSLLKYSLYEWLTELEDGRPLLEEYEKKLQANYRKSREHIYKVSGTGSYVVSEDTTTALTNLLREFNKTAPGHPGDYYQTLVKDYNAVTDCIEKINKCAKADLQVK